MPGLLLAYGHSWVAGGSASQSDRCLVSVAARLLGMASTNCGVSGSSSVQTAELVRRDGVPIGQIYLLMTGLNDARLHGQDLEALDTFAGSLRTVLDAFASTSPTARIVLIEQPPLIDYSLHPPHNRGSTTAVHAYNERLTQVAARYPQAVVVTVSAWDASLMLADDTVHPNDLGHAVIGDAVVRAHQAVCVTSDQG